MRIKLFGSLLAKLILAVTIIVLIFGVIVAFSLYRREMAVHAALTKESVLNLTSLLSTSAIDFMEDKEMKELQGFIAVLMTNKPITHIVIIDKESKVIADSNPAHVGHSENGIIFQKVLKSGEEKSVSYTRQQRDFMGSYVPVLRNPSGVARPDNIIGVAFMEVDSSKIKSQASAMARWAIYAFGLGIVCLWIVVLIAMRVLVTNPVVKLRSATTAFTRGDYSTHVDLRSKDELGDLARVFNRMVQELNKRTNETKKSREQLKSIIDNIPVAIFIKDLEGRYILVNRQFSGISRLHDKQVIDKTDHAIFSKETADDWQQKDREVMENKRILTVEEVMSHPDGTFHTYISSRLVLSDEEGLPYALLGVAMDITERKRQEELLQDANIEFERRARIMRSLLEDLDQSKRDLAERAKELARSNAELEQFAYVASHDLKEPLRMVSSYVQLLQQRYKGKLDQDADEFIYYAVDGASRMQTLIDDILAYSRVGTRGVPLEPTDCNEVLKMALDDLNVLIQESKASIVSEHLPEIAVDSAQITQLFQNLIANAIKFRQPDKPLSIKILCSRLDSGEWLFSVKDNGIGFDQQYAEKIFVIFQRLHGRGEYSGTGIGLAIAKKIVERHGGRIWAESRPGKGSTFYFAIPTASSTMYAATRHDQKG